MDAWEQDRLAVWSLVLVLGSGFQRKPVEGERPTLEAATKHGSEDVSVVTSVCVCKIVNFKV
jgi:hypothetical protein